MLYVLLVSATAVALLKVWIVRHADQVRQKSDLRIARRLIDEIRAGRLQI
jgi:hypothetical protein